MEINDAPLFDDILGILITRITRYDSEITMHPDKNPYKCRTMVIDRVFHNLYCATHIFTTQQSYKKYI